ncbi:MAG: response regulator [Lentimonas sp.]
MAIMVTDTGIDIPAEKLQTLFDKFTQVNSSTTRQYGGTGLGLAISKKLCNLTSGNIQVSSVLDEGTTMTVAIPLKCEASQDLKKAAINRPDKSNDSNPNSSATEVLLVNDNSVNQKLGLIILRRLGCNVTAADNVEEAVEHLKRSIPVIVFMDCQMPVMDGYEATKKIRELEKQGIVSPQQYPSILPS